MRSKLRQPTTRTPGTTPGHAIMKRRQNVEHVFSHDLHKLTPTLLAKVPDKHHEAVPLPDVQHCIRHSLHQVRSALRSWNCRDAPLTPGASKNTLLDIKHRRLDKPVCEPNHFNQTGHTIHNIRVKRHRLLFTDSVNDRQQTWNHTWLINSAASGNHVKICVLCVCHNK